MRKPITLFVLLLCLQGTGSAFPLCNESIKDAIYDSQFYPNLLTMLSPFIILTIIVIAMTIITNKNHRKWLATNPKVQGQGYDLVLILPKRQATLQFSL